MPTTVDNRVVEMTFNNKQFEQGVATSMSTLDKLKKALNFSSTVSNFDDVTKTFTRFGDNTLGDVAANVDNLSRRFSNWGIVGMEVIKNLTNKAINFVEQALQPITSTLGEINTITLASQGWSKYAEKTQAVQTIMATTAKTWEETAKAQDFTGTQLEFVNKIISELNWLSDETSYSLTDMITNISKFTSRDVDLYTSARALEGVALAAAAAGQSTEKAAMAMRNFADAIGMGYVASRDWMSISLTSIDTVEFKNAAIEAAVAVGTLKKALRNIDGTEVEVAIVNNDKFGTDKETIVNAQNFRDTLSEGWFVNDALLSVLNKYSNAAVLLHDLYDQYGVETVSFMSVFEQLNKGNIKMADAAKELNLPVDVLEQTVETLKSEEYELGLKAFMLGQEAITFGQAITATADATSSKWMNVFELIFGNYEEAKVLWTDLTNALFEMFAAPVETLADALTVWKYLRDDEGATGREILWEGVYRIWDELAKIGPTIIETLEKWNILEPSSNWGQKFFDNTVKFRDSVNEFFDHNWDKALKIIEGIASSFSWIVLTGKDLVHSIVDPIRKTLVPILGEIWDNFDSTTIFAKFNTKLIKLSSTIRTKFAPWFSKRSSAAITSIVELFKSLGNVLSAILNSKVLKGIWEWLKSLVSESADFLSLRFIGFVDFLKKVADKVAEIIPLVDDFISNHFAKIKEFFNSIIPKGRDNLDKAADSLGTFADKFLGLFGRNEEGKLTLFAKVGMAVGGVIEWIGDSVAWLHDNLNNLWPTIKEKFGKLKEYFKPLTDNIKGLFVNLETGEFSLEKFLALFKSGLGAALLLELTQFFGKKGLGGVFKGIASILNGDGLKSLFKKASDGLSSLLEPVKDLFSNNSIDISIVKDLAVSLLILSAACFILASIDDKKIGNVFGVITGAIIEMVSAYAMISRFSDKFESKDKNPLGRLIDGFNMRQQKGTTGSTLIKIAASLLIMAITLKKLSEIQWDHVWQSLGIMTLCLALLVGSAILLDKFAKNGTKIGTGMLLTALSLLVLATMLEKLVDLKWDSIKQGLQGVLATLVVLTICLMILSLANGGAGVAAGGFGLLLGAVALLAIAGVLRTLVGIKWDEIKQGLQGVLLTLAVLTLCLAILSAITFGVGSIAAAVGLMIAAVALVALGLALRSLTGIKWDEIWDGLKGLLIVLGALTACLGILGTFAAFGLGAIAAAAALLIATASLLIIAGAISMLTEYNWEQMAPAVKALSLVLGAVMLALNGLRLFPLGILAGAALALACAGLLLLAESLKILAGIDANGLERGTNAITVCLAAMTKSLRKLKFLGDGALKAGAGIALLAASMLLLPLVFEALGRFSEEEVTLAMSTITKVMTTFGIFGALLGVVSPLLIAGALALTVFSVALIAVGAAVGVISAAIALLRGDLSGAKERIDEVGGWFDELWAKLSGWFASIWESISGWFTQAWTDISGWFSGLWTDITTWFSDLWANIGGWFSDTWNNISTWFSDIWNDVTGWFAGIGKDIGDWFSGVWKDVTGWFSDLWKNISDWFTDLPGNISNWFTDIWDGVTGWFSDLWKNIKDWFSNLWANIGQWISNGWSTFKEAGANTIGGFITGMGEKVRAVGDAAKGVAKSAWNAITGWLQINSPSRVFAKVGAYTVEGFALGMSKNTGMATDSAVQVGENVKSALELALENANSMLENQEPVITPVIDMSNIRAGSRLISSMIGGKFDNGNIGVITDPIKPIAERMANTPSSGLLQNGGNIGAINFTINTQPGQNAEEIADEVMARMNTVLLRGKAAWA